MQRFVVQAPTDVANARRGVAALVGGLGYPETESGRVAIVVTELAQNLLRHAGGGEILAAADPHRPGGVEVLALDRGPGIRDVDASMRDGYSTGGTNGNGLGAVRRLARHMAIYSRPGAGTAVLARLDRGPRQDDTVASDCAMLCVPKPGESVCGDSAAIVRRPDGSVSVLLADGLGHGVLAAAASQAAVRLFRDYPDGGPADWLQMLHAGLRPTRGAALATAWIDPAGRQVTYGGIGNIAGIVTDSGGVRRMVSYAGTAGHTASRMGTFHYPLNDRPVLVMFSDGLASSWSPDAHPGLFAQDPILIAGVLYRDHVRGRDDASVVVWKG